MLIGKAQILAAEDRRTVTVPVPEWGADAEVCIREMSGAERDTYDQLLHKEIQAAAGKPIPNVSARMCAMCIVDESGALVFGVDDIAALGQKNGAALDRIYKAIVALNKLSVEAQEQEQKN